MFDSDTPSRDATARVWQPLELVSPAGTGVDFVKQAWSSTAAPSFTPFDLKKWEQESAHELAAKKSALAQVHAQAAKLTAEIQEIQDQEAESLAEAADPSGSAESTPKVDEATLEKIRQQAHAKGLAEGRQQMREEFEKKQSVSAKRADDVLTAIDNEVRALIEAPERWFEPLKRLALHLAEQLVLAELSLAPQAIERLVQRCIGELASADDAPLRIELHPQDAKILAPKLAEHPLWHLVPNPGLLPGSVRASVEDTQVCDLVEHRLASLARDLLLTPAAAKAQSAFQADKIRQQLAPEVEDASPYATNFDEEFDA